MPRFFVSAAPLFGGLGCLLGLAANSAQAQFNQAQSNAFLYVGTDSEVTTMGFGSATLTSQGATASGLYSFINAGPSTIRYNGLSTFSNSRLTVTGGAFQQLFAGDASVIDLVGSNFAESSGFYFNSVGDSFYTVTGTLQGDSSPFTASFYRPSSGTLEFNGVPAVPGAPASNPVPEASPFISLGLLLGLGCLAVKRRKSAA